MIVISFLFIGNKQKILLSCYFSQLKTVGSVSKKIHSGGGILRNHSNIFSRKIHRDDFTCCLAAGSRCWEGLPKSYYILIGNRKKDLVESFAILKTWRDSGKTYSTFASVPNSFLLFILWRLLNDNWGQCHVLWWIFYFWSKGNTCAYKTLELTFCPITFGTSDYATIQF